jgi:hypothetical protein
MRCDTLIRRIRRGVAHALLLALVITAAGCPFFIPLPGPGPGAPSVDVLHRIEPGVTTRADVLLALGDPDFRLEDDRYFVYDWTETHAVMGVIIAYGGAGGGVAAAVGDRHALAFEFAPDGRLARLNQFVKDRPAEVSVGVGTASGAGDAEAQAALWDDIRAWMKGTAPDAPETAK